MADALTDILRSIRMTGSVFSRAALSAPWGVESGRSHTGVFHSVVTGNMWATLADGSGAPVHLERGDVVLFPFGDNHYLGDSVDVQTRPIGLLSSVDENGMGHLVIDGGGASTSIICGTVEFDEGEAHPVFSMLPRMLCVRDRTGRASGVVTTIVDLISEEVDQPGAGTETIVARLTDVLIVYLLRDYIEQLEPGSGGWLGGLRDPGIRTVLGHMHRTPERDWSATDLANAAGMSRSSFFARFRETVGETPSEYLTRWRVHAAAQLLRDERYSVARAAHEVGYRTEAGLSNAFVRIMGVRPGAYKRSRHEARHGVVSEAGLRASP